MPNEKIQGYDNRVRMYRAKASSHADLDHDPSDMVQEQIARLKFFFGQVDGEGRRILDWGCGTGYCCRYVCEKFGAERAMGADICPAAVEFARQAYPEGEFRVGDLCNPALDLGWGSWDFVLCCEVFEHVQDPGALLDGIVRHLAPGGTALISTPNKMVFSLGYEPSPVNRTHVKEYRLEEFRQIIASRFSRTELTGQRLKSRKLFSLHQAALRRSIRDYRILGRFYWNPWIRRLFQLARLERLLRLLHGSSAWKHDDFEFTSPPCDDSIWFCAVVRK